MPESEVDDFAVDEEDTVEHWLASYSAEAAISRQITDDVGLDDLVCPAGPG